MNEKVDLEEEEQTSQDASASTTSRLSASETLVVEPPSQESTMSNVKMERWMRQARDEEEPLALVTYRPGVSGKTRVSAPEAVMVETGVLRETILKRIVHKIRNLASKIG